MIKLIENYEPELFEKIVVGEELSACLISTLYELYLSDENSTLLEGTRRKRFHPCDNSPFQRLLTYNKDL